MRSRFSILSRVALGSARWDALCAESHDAWFFHTSCWAPILKIEDASFAVVDRDGKPMALVRLGWLKNNPGAGLTLSNLRAGIAHTDGLPLELRHELDRFALSEVQRIAMSNRAFRIDWELPSMPPGPETLVPSLRECGYQLDTWPAKVVDLTLDEDALWRDYRKGCKSVIRRAERLGVTVHEATDESDVGIFSDMHSRRMRSLGAPSWDPDVFKEMWGVLSPLGQCEILLASLPSGVPVSGILVLSYKNMAYYHAACSDPEHMDSGGNTLLVHEAVRRAKSRGATSFHMGPSPLATQAAEKAYLVGRFKNQFGGQQREWVMASLVLRAQSSPASRPQPSPVVRTRFSVRRMVSATLPPGVKRSLRNLRPNQ
jgi:Acetyltransferase (GNAT) domain